MEKNDRFRSYLGSKISKNWLLVLGAEKREPHMTPFSWPR